MRQIVKRFGPGIDLKQEIIKLAQEEKISSGVILCIVGSLSHVCLRMPVLNHKVVNKNWDGDFEIVSGTGTICQNGTHAHIHLSFSDKDSNCFGGHLVDGCISKTTVELVILTFEDKTFTRRLDPETGFDELVVSDI